MKNYPARPEIKTQAVIGSEDQWVASPMGSLLRVMGTGVYTTLSKFMYPGDSRPWHLASVLELRDGGQRDHDFRRRIRRSRVARAMGRAEVTRRHRSPRRYAL